MHAYCVSQGMLFQFGDLEYCFILCMFGCLWIFSCCCSFVVHKHQSFFCSVCGFHHMSFCFMHVYYVSQGMLFHFGDLEYCFILCMFGCLWIFFLLLFTNINVFCFVCGFSSHEFLFHACLLCLTRNVVSFW